MSLYPAPVQPSSLQSRLPGLNQIQDHTTASSTPVDTEAPTSIPPPDLSVVMPPPQRHLTRWVTSNLTTPHNTSPHLTPHHPTSSHHTSTYSYFLPIAYRNVPAAAQIPNLSNLAGSFHDATSLVAACDSDGSLVFPTRQTRSQRNLFSSDSSSNSLPTPDHRARCPHCAKWMNHRSLKQHILRQHM